jgi:hypothetical protein
MQNKFHTEMMAELLQNIWARRAPALGFQSSQEYRPSVEEVVDMIRHAGLIYLRDQQVQPVVQNRLRVGYMALQRLSTCHCGIIQCWVLKPIWNRMWTRSIQRFPWDKSRFLHHTLPRTLPIYLRSSQQDLQDTLTGLDTQIHAILTISTKHLVIALA